MDNYRIMGICGATPDTELQKFPSPDDESARRQLDRIRDTRRSDFWDGYRLEKIRQEDGRPVIIAQHLIEKSG